MVIPPATTMVIKKEKPQEPPEMIDHLQVLLGGFNRNRILLLLKYVQIKPSTSAKAVI